MKKRIMVLCLVFIMMLGVSGCMAKESKSINELALEYMEKKYGEPFEYAGPTGDSLTGTHTIKVECESLPESVIVEVENYQKPNRVFLDNYIAVKYKTQTSEFLQACAEQVFNEAEVFYDVQHIGFDFPADTSFQQYIAAPDVLLNVIIEIKASSFSSREQAMSMAKSIAESGAHFSIVMVVMPDEEYGIYNEDQLQPKLVKRDFVDCARIKNPEGSIQLSWVERKP